MKTFILLFLISLSANAQIESLSCYGVGDQWVDEANKLINGLEKKTNAFVDDHISFLNFDMGNSRFGIQGNAGLGNLHAPPFDCSRPKEVLKSGIADFGLSPHYILTARLFGLPVQVIDARLEGGQGPRTEINPRPEGSRKNKLRLSVKVIGIDVLHKVTRAPETEVYDPMASVPNPGQLPPSDKTGVSGKLLDITRSISESLGGQQPRIDIIPPILYVGIDAGFYLQSNLIFTYGVNSPFFNMNKTVSLNEIRSSLKENPANATDSFCEGAPGTTQCNKTSSILEKKGREFYQTLSSAVRTPVDQVNDLRKKVRDLNTKELIKDALLTRDAFASDWQSLTQSGLTVAQRKELISGTDFASQLRPLEGAKKQINGIFDSAQSLQSNATKHLERINTVSEFLKSGDGSQLPEVRASAGVAISGKVGGWATAMLVLDLALAKGYAGIQGYVTLIDVRAGLGASLSTKSQYLDMTASLEQIRLMGGLDLVYGVSIGIAPMETKYEGRKNIFSFPGSMTKKDWLAGRFDFRPPQGKPRLFWCWDLFGNATSDKERCMDGDIAQSEVATGLLAHKELKKELFNELILDPSADCLISVGGKLVATTDAASCPTVLPASASTRLSLNQNQVHVLTHAYHTDPSIFHTHMRDEMNRPAANFSAVSGSGVVNRIFSNKTAIPPPIITNSSRSPASVGFPQTSPSMPSNEKFDAPIEDLLFSLNRQPIFVQRMGTPLTKGLPSDSDLAIEMDFASIVNPIYSNSAIFVGDLLALPNEILIEMAKTFRLGRCQATVEDNELYLSLGTKPYPGSGDPAGKVANNLSLEDDSCSVGANSGFNDPLKVFAACSLRDALQNNECFPPERMVDLVKLANLPNTDVLEYFLAPAGSPDKLISGTVAKESRQIDINVRWRLKINDNKSPSNLEGLYRPFFAGTGFGSPNYHSNNSLRCNLNGVSDDNTNYQYDHWFERDYHSNCFTCQSSHELFINTHPSDVCFKVQGAGLKSYSIGSSPSCKNRAFKARYEYQPGTAATSVLCNSSNPGFRDNIHIAAQASLLASARSNLDGGTEHGTELAGAIKKCIADGGCTYAPVTPMDVATGPSSSCDMAIESGSNKTIWNGPSNTLSLNACLQEANSPGFADAQDFCRDERIKQILKSQSASRDGSYHYTLSVKWASGANNQSLFVGKCFAKIENGEVTMAMGQSNGSLSSLLSSGSGSQLSNCALSIGVDAGSTPILVKKALKDPVTNPDASNANCWKALGFEDGYVSQNQSYANDICKTVSSDVLIGLFARDAELNQSILSSPSSSTISRSAVISTAGYNQACQFDFTADAWKQKINNGKCTLKLESLSALGALSQDLPVDYNAFGTGLNACTAALAQYTCSKVQSLEAYLPYSLPFQNQIVGARISPYYGSLSLTPAFNCNGAYDPAGELSPPNNSCVANLTISNPALPGPFFSAPLVSKVTPTNTDSCNAAWKTGYERTPASGVTSNALFCAQSLGQVTDTLINSGRIPRPVATVPYTYWYYLPMNGDITLAVETSYNNNTAKHLFDCTYRFRQKSLAFNAPAGTMREWVLMSDAESSAQTTPDVVNDSELCKSNVEACGMEPVATKPGVVTILLALGDIAQEKVVITEDSARLVAQNAIKFASPVLRPKVLVVKDHASNGESDSDTEYIQKVLLTDYKTEIFFETKLGLTDKDLEGYDVVWFNNPGHPMGSSKTYQVLKNFKGGVILSGDDLTMGSGFNLEELTGLKYVDNGTQAKCGDTYLNMDNNQGNKYQVEMSSTFLPGIPESIRVFEYGNDIDNSVLAFDEQKFEVLAYATIQSKNCDNKRPVIVRYTK